MHRCGLPCDVHSKTQYYFLVCVSCSQGPPHGVGHLFEFQTESLLENGSIESSLEAAVAWVEDGGLETQTGRGPWYKFGAFLYAGKIYE